MAMALEAKSVKSSLGSRPKVRPLTAMAFNAQSRPRAVGIVVMAGEAIDRTVFVVRKIEL